MNFYICRAADCKFPAAKTKNAEYKSADNTPRADAHVKNLAFPDKTADVIPIIDKPRPRGIAQVHATLEKLVLGFLVWIFAACLRLKQLLADIVSERPASYAISRLFHVIVENISSRILAVVLGVSSGVAMRYREDHPPGTPWVTRLI